MKQHHIINLSIIVAIGLVFFLFIREYYTMKQSIKHSIDVKGEYRVVAEETEIVEKYREVINNDKRSKDRIKDRLSYSYGISDKCIDFILDNPNLRAYRIDITLSNALIEDIYSIEFESDSDDYIITGMFLIGDQPWLPKLRMYQSEEPCFVIMADNDRSEDEVKEMLENLRIYFLGITDSGIKIKNRIWLHLD